jgi:transposase
LTVCKAPAGKLLKDIADRRLDIYSAEEKVRIALEGLRREENRSDLCHSEGIAASMCMACPRNSWKSTKRRIAGDTVRARTGCQ